MKNRMICENRNKRQKDLILTWYFTYDLLALLCGIAFFVSIFVAIFAPGQLWLKILILCILAVPVLIRTILTIRLNNKLNNSPSKTIVIQNPVAKVSKTRQGGDYFIRGLRIKGEYNAKKISLFEYPLKNPSSLLRKEKEINDKASIEVSIIEGTHVINNFYDEKKRDVSKKTISSYQNQTSGKEKKFKFSPISVNKEDLVFFLSNYFGYEELYLLSSSNKYTLLKLTASNDENKRYITLDKQDIDSVIETIEWLEMNDYLMNDKVKLLAIIDLNDPNGFYQELETLK